MDSVWILGDQLNRKMSPLATAKPGELRILMVESAGLIKGRRWHRQRIHLYLSAMRHFARELAEEGFDVDYRKAPTLGAGLAEHRNAFRPERVRSVEPMRWRARDRFREWDVELEQNDRFLCSSEEFRTWAGDKKNLRLESFYRWQRKRLDILMDGDEPAGGRWNFDDQNREPLPRKKARKRASGPDSELREPVNAPGWPDPIRFELDEIDREVLNELDSLGFGAEPDGTWATSRQDALRQLRTFIDAGLPRFGPHQDAMTQDSWHLAHSLLSPSLNLGLLHPREVCAAAEQAYRDGQVPIASAEGFIRQMIGWREYVWGVYWLWMPEYRELNVLGGSNSLLPCFEDPRRTDMTCVRSALEGVQARGYAHHIERLMVLANLATLAGVEPQSFLDWMERAFVDAAEWVMVPNVIGMGMHADGGRMATKPYVSGGAYISRMSDHCGRCRYDPKRRTGDEACPFTSLYWRFIDQHQERLAGNPRTAMPVRSLAKLRDREDTLARAEAILADLAAGRV